QHDKPGAPATGRSAQRWRSGHVRIANFRSHRWSLSLMRRAFFAYLIVLAAPAFAHAEGSPFSPRQAVEHFQMPKGFRSTLFAGEPDLIKPIAMTTDDRGRLWVIESHSYPNWLPEGRPGRDRILIFEDRKGRGHFDSCKVFWDKGTNLSGIAL